MSARSRSCPSCRSIGAPDRACQDLWHIEVRPIGDADRIARAVVAALDPRLARIERALRSLGGDMSELDDKLTTIEQAEQAQGEAITRALADLAEVKAELADAGHLTEAQAARLDGIAQAISASTATIDEVDPAPAAEPTA